MAWTIETYLKRKYAPSRDVVKRFFDKTKLPSVVDFDEWLEAFNDGTDAVSKAKARRKALQALNDILNPKN